MRHAVLLSLSLLCGAACHSQTLVACSTDAQCGTNMHCVPASKHTAASCAPGPHCGADVDCPAALPSCAAGLCISICLQATAPACPGGQTCVPSAEVSPPFTCTALHGCGDGLRSDPEACDGNDLRGQSCSLLGLGSGTLRCSPGCNFDTSDCSTAYRVPSTCGNGKLEASEACDGGAVAPQLTCAAYGYAEGGALLCNAKTCQADTRGCYACGNEHVEGAELCDGSKVGAGITCASQGFDAGSIACNLTCNGYDTTQCQRCGNGVLEGTEVCDGVANRDTCITAGFRSGSLTCHSDCQGYDTTACSNWYPLGTSNGPLGLSSNLANDGNGATWPALLFLGDGTPMAVWRDRSGNTCAAAHVFTGGLWAPLANATSRNVNGACMLDQGRPSAAYSLQDDSAYVAWSAPLQDGNVFVARSTASGWVPVGNSNNNADGITSGVQIGGYASYPSLSVSPDVGGLAVVVWQQDQGSGALRVYGRMQQGNVWADLPGGGSSGAGIGAGTAPPQVGELALPQVAVDANHTLFVAWEGSTSALAPTLFVRSLSNGGTTWTDLPSLPFPAQTAAARQPTLRLDGAGALWVAWTNSTGSPYGQIVAAKYQNGTWVDAAGGTSHYIVQPNFQSEAANPSIAFDPNNDPVVAYEDVAQAYTSTNTVDSTRQVYLRRFSAGAWVGVDNSDSLHGVSNSDKAALHPSAAWLQTASGGNTLCLAWEHAAANVSPHQIRALCHDL